MSTVDYWIYCMSNYKKTGADWESMNGGKGRAKGEAGENRHTKKIHHRILCFSNSARFYFFK